MEPSRSSSVSPKSPFIKKKRFFDSTSSNACSQDLVCWHETASSPVVATKKHRSSNQLVQTPVRVVKRCASSPLLTAPKCERSRLKDLQPQHRFGQKIEEESAEDLKEETQQGSEEKRAAKLNDSFDLSSDEFKFDLDDQDLILALKKMEEDEAKAKKDRLTNLIKESTVKLPAPVPSTFGIDDSFDDAFLNSIPLEEISKKCAKEKITNVDIKFDPSSGLSQIVPSTILPRCSSDPSISRNASTAAVKGKSNNSMARHNSLLNPKTTVAKPVAHQVQPQARPQVLQGDKKIFTTNRICTPAEIAAKRRLAQERLAATRLKQKLKNNRL